IIVPMQPSPTDLWATKATLDLAEAEKIPVMVVLNRVSHNSRLAPEIVKQLKHHVGAEIGNRVIFASSLLEGRTATEIAPTSPEAQEIKALVKKVTDRFVVKDDDTEAKPAAKKRSRVTEAA